MFVKIHRSYRAVVAVCDSDILGKKFEEGKHQLHIAENFYKGEELQEEEIIELIRIQKMEDATFNIAGVQAVAAALKAGIIDKFCIGAVQGVPFALTLL